MYYQLYSTLGPLKSIALTKNYVLKFPKKNKKNQANSSPGPLKPSSVRQDVPHPRHPLDVLHDPLHTSQVIKTTTAAAAEKKQ